MIKFIAAGISGGDEFYLSVFSGTNTASGS